MGGEHREDWLHVPPLGQVTSEGQAECRYLLPAEPTGVSFWKGPSVGRPGPSLT